MNITRQIFSKALFLSLLIGMNPAHMLSVQPIEKTEVGAASLDASHPVSEKEILDVFFRALFEKSQGGYVLYGSKPICGEGILPRETRLFMLGDDQHKNNITFKEGVKTWKRLPCQGKKYFVHLCEKPSYGWLHLLLINREAFIKVVKENLPLFQYVLGPDVFPEKLFEKLMDPKESFASTFKDNRVLIGIVLGFGTQNALYVSREENIEESLEKKEKLPFRSVMDRSKENKKWGATDWKTAAAPGFGHSSLKDELDHLNETLFVSKDLVEKQPLLIPWFGCLKNRETEQLLKGYTKTRSRIHDLIKDDRFLERVLTRFWESDASNIISDLSSTYRDSGLNPGLGPSSVIAQAIYQGMPEHDVEWIASFIDGMQSQQRGEPLLTSPQWIDVMGDYQQTKEALEAKQNLTGCEQVFSDLGRREDLIALIPDKLYYRVLKTGKGQAIETTHSIVEMDYVIKDHSGAVLAAAQSSDQDSIDVATLVMGLSSGMQGMSMGEKREIYIHPSLAYGETSNFSPNTGLIIEVTLRGIDHQEKEKKEPALIPLNLLAADTNESEIRKNFQTFRHQVASQLGARTWAHFRRGQNAGYSLSAITQSLLQLSKDEVIYELSPEADEWLTQVHWRIYHRAD